MLEGSELWYCSKIKAMHSGKDALKNDPEWLALIHALPQQGLTDFARVGDYSKYSIEEYVAIAFLTEEYISFINDYELFKTDSHYCFDPDETISIPLEAAFNSDIENEKGEIERVYCGPDIDTICLVYRYFRIVQGYEEPLEQEMQFFSNVPRKVITKKMAWEVCNQFFCRFVISEFREWNRIMDNPLRNSSYVVAKEYGETHPYRFVDSLFSSSSMCHELYDDNLKEWLDHHDDDAHAQIKLVILYFILFLDKDPRSEIVKKYILPKVWRYYQELEDNCKKVMALLTPKSRPLYKFNNFEDCISTLTRDYEIDQITLGERTNASKSIPLLNIIPEFNGEKLKWPPSGEQLSAYPDTIYPTMSFGSLSRNLTPLQVEKIVVAIKESGCLGENVDDAILAATARTLTGKEFYSPILKVKWYHGVENKSSDPKFNNLLFLAKQLYSISDKYARIIQVFDVGNVPYDPSDFGSRSKYPAPTFVKDIEGILGKII